MSSASWRIRRSCSRNVSGGCVSILPARRCHELCSGECSAKLAVGGLTPAPLGCYPLEELTQVRALPSGLRPGLASAAAPRLSPFFLFSQGRQGCSQEKRLLLFFCMPFEIGSFPARCSSDW